MLALLRIVFGFALFSVFAKAVRLAGPDPRTEGTTDAGYLALAVGIGILNAIVWAPWIGRLMADPLTGAFTTGNPGDLKNSWLQFAHKLALRRWRRCALFFAFCEGVRHPDLPGAFVLGLNHARPGSWLQTVFAREVWRFDNAENCLKAWRVLRARGLDPDLHRRAEVNLLIQGQTRVVPPPPLPLAVPQAPPPAPPKRNDRIQLFRGTMPNASEVSPSPTDPAPSTDAILGPEGSGPADCGSTPPPTNPPQSGPAEPDPGSQAGLAPSPVAPRMTLKERLRVLLTGRTDR